MEIPWGFLESFLSAIDLRQDKMEKSHNIFITIHQYSFFLVSIKFDRNNDWLDDLRTKNGRNTSNCQL